MTTATLARRHSIEDAKKIIARFNEYSFDDLHKVFREGKAPAFAEIEGDTLGGFLALKPKAGWWQKAALAITFDNPLARWKGKRFITPFAEDKTGKGVNLFKNRIFPQRFGINTSLGKSLFDQNPCLVVTYPHFPLSLFGLRDELKRIDDGVFLGQWHQKLSRGKQSSLQGYFVICA